MTRMPEMFSCTRSDTAAKASCTLRKRTRVTVPRRKMSTSSTGMGARQASASRQSTPVVMRPMENRLVKMLVLASAMAGPKVMRMALTSLMA